MPNNIIIQDPHSFDWTIQQSLDLSMIGSDGTNLQVAINVTDLTYNVSDILIFRESDKARLTLLSADQTQCTYAIPGFGEYYIQMFGRRPARITIQDDLYYKCEFMSDDTLSQISFTDNVIALTLDEYENHGLWVPEEEEEDFGEPLPPQYEHVTEEVPLTENITDKIITLQNLPYRDSAIENSSIVYRADYNDNNMQFETYKEVLFSGGGSGGGGVYQDDARFLGRIISSGDNTFSGENTFEDAVDFQGTVTFSDITTFSKVIMGTAYRALSADVAEYYSADEDLEPGTLVQFGGVNEITKADERVNGVVSSDPAYILNGGKDMEHPTLLALTGRIPVKVLGPVHKFDLICLSDVKGVAKVDNLCYTPIGRALEENLDEGEKLVECVVKLHI
jgi:hypothetical protein